ncbi:uncharacterized protein LOC134316035 [Trichomycterus rosablanca]|uniref:uncharacterized protein LOC134316035 n=1 Tax=Trichomycterus rosablanca TaxID=2290929 RepID=UPI002F34FD71
MNWVGGWRSRVMKSSDMKKQKEFFEKKKMEKRRNVLAPPPSPKGNNVGNMDLLTMFIVNQIALKKEHHSCKLKITHLPDSKKTHKSIGVEPLELPMSPCSPSRLSLAQSDPHYSEDTLGWKKRKQLLDEYKFKMLSPLLETNLSENSASECQNRAQDGASSFSSAVSSNVVNLQSRPTTLIPCQPQSELYCTNTSQALGLCDDDLWAAMHAQTQPSQTSQGDQAQFGSILQRCTEAIGQSINMTGYPLTTSQKNDQEEPLFLGFSTEEFGDEGVFSKKSRKITLQGEILTSPTKAHEPHSGDCNAEFLPQFTQGVENTQLMQSAASHLHSCFLADTPVARLCSPDRSAPTRVLSFSQNVTSKPMIGDKSTSIRDQGTQTGLVLPATSQDASVQCCLLKPRKPPELRSVLHHERTCKAPATRRHTGHISKRHQAPSDSHEVNWNTPWIMTSSREPTQRGPETTRGRGSSHKADSQACMRKQQLLHHAHTNAAEPHKQLTENVLMIRKCGDNENSTKQSPTENPVQSEEHDGGFLAERGKNRVSEETGALQEIADILLMMKQKNKQS